ncbi:3-oxoacyl-[acyl-carrier-protein] FabG [Cyphellophora attinorum]|uniref:3-oxoacyl-[acyl-carrier-protein] FabG n=1 Tax=Cyphellophora attinorum TaxID=1664694 RepID=A0A0N1H2T8_9EURO|nr:3-oxoacyl-[acyl-carrier-protein] FabG [Phialophora attinorum]KPI35666.1 3-oxoacyl-[acyl-carrier-protein] FabG [Phialophora attinorum]
MTTYPFNVEQLTRLKGKTLLITGAGSGIGRETARAAYKSGANVALADWNEKDTQALLSELKSAQAGVTADRIIFRKTNVANFEDVLEIFQLTWKTFGTIDAVISNAGVSSGEDLFDDEIDPESGKLMAPKLRSIDINLTAHLLRREIITSSAAGILDTPPVYLYCTAKTGLIGLMRGLRTSLIKRNISINVVAPWLTVTAMVPQGRLALWEGLPLNQPATAAHALLLPVLQPEINGKCFFIAGDEIVEFEDKLHETQPLWMGSKQLSDSVDEGQRRMIGVIQESRAIGL